MKKPQFPKGDRVPNKAIAFDGWATGSLASYRALTGH
jgi:hypothetical protein